MKFSRLVEEYLQTIDSEAGRRNAECAFTNFRNYCNLSLIEFAEQIDGDREKPIREKKHPWRIQAQEFSERLSEEKQLAESTIKNYLSMIRAFIYYLGIPEGTLQLKYVSIDSQPGPTKKHRWTRREVEEFIMNFENVRNKAVASLIAQSGLSVVDILSLTYGQAEEELEEPPLGLRLTRKKTNVEFYAFASETTIQLLREYLSTRSTLKERTPLIVSLRDESSITTSALTNAFSRNAETCEFVREGERATPHSLRSYAYSQLKNSELDNEEINFLMGHKLKISRGGSYLRRSFSEWKERYHQVASDYLSLDL